MSNCNLSGEGLARVCFVSYFNEMIDCSTPDRSDESMPDTDASHSVACGSCYVGIRVCLDFREVAGSVLG